MNNETNQIKNESQEEESFFPIFQEAKNNDTESEDSYGSDDAIVSGEKVKHEYYAKLLDQLYGDSLSDQLHQKRLRKDTPRLNYQFSDYVTYEPT